MESRIRQIDNVIRNHEIVERDSHADVVQHASIVKVVYEGDDEADFQEFFIGSIEERPMTSWSPRPLRRSAPHSWLAGSRDSGLRSPLGRAASKDLGLR